MTITYKKSSKSLKVLVFCCLRKIAFFVPFSLPHWRKKSGLADLLFCVRIYFTLTEPVPMFWLSAKMSQRYVPALNVSPTGM